MNSDEHRNPKNKSRKRKREYLLVLANSGGVSWRFWSVQGDAAARVDEGDGGRWWRSSCGLVRREEEEDEKEKRGE